MSDLDPRIRAALPVRIRKGYRDGQRVWEIMARDERDGEVEWSKIADAADQYDAEHIAACINSCAALSPETLGALTLALHAFSEALSVHAAVFIAAPTMVDDGYEE